MSDDRPGGGSPGREKAEQALRESERKYRSLAENSPDNILLYDAEGRLLYINRNMRQTVGVDLVPALGSRPEDVLAMAPPEGYLETLHRVLTTGVSGDLQVDVRNPDGELRIHHLRLVAERDEEGKIVGALAIGRDITEIKKSEATLRKLLHAMGQSPASVVITDLNGNIEYVNPKFTEVTGYSEAEVLGQNPRVLKSGEMPSGEYRRLWETITSGKEWRGEFHNRRKDGTLYWESASISPVFDDAGAITHFMAVKEDITERRRLEEQLHQAMKLEAVGRLAGGVAHDFNNMLSVILGHAELALHKIDAAHPLHADLLEIHKAAGRSADLTRQLLAFARRQAANPKVLELNETVEGMLKMLRRLIGEDIELVWIPGGGLKSIKADPSQIDQILANLCINARDAIGGVGRIAIETGMTTLDELSAAAHSEGAPGEYAWLSVTDNGCGMDEETRSRIFEPFFTTKEAGKGTGLGLATVYGIVRQNEGFIDVKSAPEKGSTFRIHLPSFVRTESASPRPIREALPLGEETILLVEDDPVILVLIRNMLGEFGYKVLAAPLPREALRLAGEHAGKIDLLLTDVIMPEMNGRDLAREVAALSPGIRSLYMSGYSGDVIAHHGFLDGSVDLVQKPFSMQTLAGRVRQALDRENTDTTTS